MATDDFELIDLRARVAKLERLLVATYGIILTVVMVVGLSLPFLVEHAGRDDEEPWSVLGYVFQPPDFSDHVPFAIAMIIGFIGLLVVVLLILLIVVLAAARGTMTDRSYRYGRVLVTLGIIGATVVVLLSLIALRLGIEATGPGGLILLLGMLGVLPLLSQAGRSLVSDKR